MADNDEVRRIAETHKDDKTALGALIRMEPVFKDIGAKVHQELTTEGVEPKDTLEAFIKLTAVLTCSIAGMMARPGVEIEVIKQILEGIAICCIQTKPGLKEAMESDFKKPDDQSSN